jgi:hypothetical protein
MTAEPYYADGSVTLLLGDCLDVLAGMDAASVDAVVTDPPYGLGFMGKAWDGLPPGREWAEACMRVLKPGGHLLAFGGTRTWHRLAAAVEDAGFEIRDSIAWLYGSGFPKSLDVSKAIDKAAGAEREVVGRRQTPTGSGGILSARAQADHGYRPPGREFEPSSEVDLTAPATPAAQQWEGWGTALKPAFEPIVVARKPLIGTVAANVLTHGTGALNIDSCRVKRSDDDRTEYGRGVELPHANTTASLGKFAKVTPYAPDDSGRWPANVILDDTQAAELDRQTGVQTSGTAVMRNLPDEGSKSAMSRSSPAPNAAQTPATETRAARPGSSPRSTTKRKPQPRSGHEATTAKPTPPSNPST